MRFENNINNDWLFSKTELLPNSLEELKDYEKIDLPHTYNAHDGQDGGNDYYKNKAVYAKLIKRPDVPDDYEIYLNFEGVNSIAKVYADGEFVIEHRGGYSRFRANISKFFENKKETLIVVEVDNKNYSDVYPQMADFTFYGGIYRDVSLIAVPATHFELEYYAADGIELRSEINDNNAILSVRAYVKEASEYDMLSVEVYDVSGENKASAYTRAKDVTELKLFIKDVILWHGIERPHLYNVIVSIIRNNDVIDEISLDHGVREFKVDPKEGFILNGVSTPLRGVSRHQDRRLKGNALDYANHIEDALIMEELGANTVRLAHYQQAQEFYDICDAKGLVVWAEIPFISVMNKDKKAHDNAILQMKELIYQNFNHTSICFWGISNEITIGGDSKKLVENLKELNELVKSIDDTRLSTMAQVSMVPKDSEHNQITDILAYNHYFGWYVGDYTQNEVWLDDFHDKYPDRALGLSEYGCEGIISWHSDAPKCKDYTEEYQALYHEHMAKILEERPYIWGSYVWNMFDFGCDARDEGGVKGRNNKGLVTFDRQIRKDSFYIYKAYWSDEPFVHICSKRYSDRANEKIDIKVYSNLDEVALYVDGNLFKKLAGDKVFIFKDVPLNKEYNFIEARAVLGSDYEDEIYADITTFRKIENEDKAYIRPVDEEDESTGVKNWFEDIDIDSIGNKLEFKEGFYSIKDNISDVINNEETEIILLDALNKYGSMKIKRSMLGMFSEIAVEDMGTFIGLAKDKKEKLFALINSELQKIKK